MTPLETFEKIGEKNTYWTSLTRRGGQRYCVDLHQEGAEIIEYDTPEEAIEAACAKLFPPIPKTVGCWEWRGELKMWESRSTVAALCEEGQGGSCYKFTLGTGSITSERPGYLYSDELQDFLKLIEVNPELLPPTKETTEEIVGHTVLHGDGVTKVKWQEE